MSKMYTSSSPHLRSASSTRKIMLDVIIALVPAAVMSVVYFGWRSLMLIGICVFTCVFSEYISRIVMKRHQTIGDLSAVVTGLLLALNLPSTLNPLMAVLGSVVAIVVVKQMFGGIGMNFVNPALAARIVLTVSFPTAMTTWAPTMHQGVDAVTSATPMVAPESFSYFDLIIGNHGGSMGETCVLALLAGGLYLMIKRVIVPTIPVVYIGTVFVMAWLLNFMPDVSLDPVKQVLSGGLILGAVFMATDYVTSPITRWGKVVYAVGCGMLTILIRVYANLPEGVSFSILLMNILTPLIEAMTTPKPFGSKKREGAK